MRIKPMIAEVDMGIPVYRLDGGQINSILALHPKHVDEGRHGLVSGWIGSAPHHPMPLRAMIGYVAPTIMTFRGALVLP
jgi:hypothetical protein